MTLSPKVLSAGRKAEAKRLGLKTYLTDRPCVRGHLAPRYVSTGTCLECNSENKAKWYHESGGAAVERLSSIRRRFGLSTLEFYKLYEEGNRSCAICSEPLGMRDFHLDHNHQSGQPRGILCAPCNLGLGQFKDSPELLRKAASYIERTSK